MPVAAAEYGNKTRRCPTTMNELGGHRPKSRTPHATDCCPVRRTIDQRVCRPARIGTLLWEGCMVFMTVFATISGVYWHRASPLVGEAASRSGRCCRGSVDCEREPRCLDFSRFNAGVTSSDKHLCPKCKPAKTKGGTSESLQGGSFHGPPPPTPPRSPRVKLVHHCEKPFT